ncbi:protein transport protein Sec31A [Daktulosphaira vitifoliae]|uniref:protein transport protein Sec31A n=1 Tax=Daktulosphaira vitifoliae TaxID=58002 RepID=UPI0021A9A1B4|nr:protein transport protein Sec31A [Daktulosphaira vitifoliae]
MKIKQLPTTVVSAWSPKAHQPLTIATGTAAQQLDASFSTSSTLELYTVNANEITLSHSVSTDCRFHKLVWGAYDIYNEWSSGIIAGGCDNGKICLYNVSKLAMDEDSLITTSDRHVGSVKALDFNSFQKNLLASGASESEIFIWDLFNMTSPMTPGSKSDNLEDVIDLAWNNEVQHILGSLFHKYTVVWDLRKNEPILKLTDDNNTKLRWKSMAWNPNIATQLCIASEDDQYPVIQLWDLRYASSPVKNLIGHQKGILSISWCSHDANLLISCGKDSRICLWNPSSESDENLLLCDLEHDHQWNFEVNWCPKDPLLLETSSFDGITTFYSLNNVQSVQNYQTGVRGNLNNAPKWLRRTCKTSFAFGGHLLSLDGALKTVQINKTITEPDMLVWSENLRKTLNNECYDTFFNEKCKTTDTNIQQTWEFISSMFQDKPKEVQLKILGYPVDIMDDVATKFQNGNYSDENKIKNHLSSPKLLKFDESEIVSKFENLKIPTSNLQMNICQLLLIGNKTMAADILFDNGYIVEAMLLAYNSDSDTLTRIQNKFFKTTEGLDAALLYTIVTGNWQNFAENCNLSCWKEIMAALLTHTSGQMFVSCIEKLGSRLAVDSNYSQYAKFCFISSGNIEAFIENTNYIDSVTKLQQCVEITLILHKSLMFSESNFSVGKNFNDLLVKYSECLVSQGDLNGALEFLELTNNSQGIELKNQLYKALGINQVAHYSNQPTQRRTSMHAIRKFSTCSATGTITPEPPFPIYPNKVLPEKEIPHNYSVQPNTSYSSQPLSMCSLGNPQQLKYHGSPITLPPQIVSNNQTNIPTNRIPSTPPLNNDSSRSITPSGLKSGKPKYVVDPSVKGNSYGAYNNNSGGMPHLLNSYNQSQNMLSNQLGQFNNNQFQQNSFNQTTDQTYKFLNPLRSHIQPTNLIQPLAQFPQHVNQSDNTGQTLNLNQFIPTVQPDQFQSNNIAQPAIPHPSAYNQLSNFNSTPPGINPLLNNYVQKSTPAGWNDPPMLSNSDIIQKKPQTPVPSAPITHPLYTNNPPPIQEIGTYIPLQSDQNTNNSTPECVEALPKPPIPHEHIRIKHIFEALQSHVLSMAPNAQNKKRILDISKKLEILYDSLRVNNLSSYCTQSIHTILDMVMQQNYNEAFNILTQLVSGPEFSKISSFIPSIKTLLQMAHHYNINLERI